MGAITDLFKSERGLLTVAIIAAATVLCGTHQLTVEQWTTFVQWVFGIYVAGKTVTGAVAAYTAPDPNAQPKLDSLVALAKQYFDYTVKTEPANGTARTQEPPGATGTSSPHPNQTAPGTAGTISGTTPATATQGATS